MHQDRRALEAKIDVVETAEIGFIDRLRAELDIDEQPEEVKEGEVV